MSRTVVLLSIPGLRSRDLGAMPRLLDLTRKGISVPLRHSGPALSGPVQANLTTGVGPAKHGIIGSGFFSWDGGGVQRWTTGGDFVEVSQVWETLKAREASLASAVWFASPSQGSRADFLCSASPVPHPAGNESPWFASKPPELYGALQEGLGPFPTGDLREPRASLKSTAWIVDSFVQSAYTLRPRFSFVGLPHLVFAAHHFGPDSTEARNAVAELDMAIGALVDGFNAARIRDVTWLTASEYCVTPVSSAGWPNRVLREAGLLSAVLKDGVEQLDQRETPALAMVDHQLAHVYVRDASQVARVADVLRNDPAVGEVLVGDERATVGLNHPRSGDIVLVARPEAWFADDWTTEGSGAGAALDLVKGSHGSLASDEARDGIIVSSEPADWFAGKEAGILDTDVRSLVLSLFGFR